MSLCVFVKKKIEHKSLIFYTKKIKQKRSKKKNTLFGSM